MVRVQSESYIYGSVSYCSLPEPLTSNKTIKIVEFLS